jgi:diadenylate cyclase
VVADERGADIVHLLTRLAPGTVLREGIDRIIGAGRGALIVVGWNDEVEALVSGGFVIDTNATAQRIAELAKMDGALILDDDAGRVLRANVHLVPDASVHTSETGTRHRSAERTARQTGMPVISVSESMSLVTIYLGERKRVLEDVSTLLFRANQALATLERYTTRLDEVTSLLGGRELFDTVTLRDVVVTLQRTEMVRRIAREVDELVAELGSEGRLIELQRTELVTGLDEERVLLVRDYLADRRRKVHTVLRDLDALDTDELLDMDHLAEMLSYEAPRPMEHSVVSRGHRQLSRIPRVPATVVDKLVAKYQTLPRIVAASESELVEIDGIGEARAGSIREGLDRLVESAQLDRPL